MKLKLRYLTLFFIAIVFNLNAQDGQPYRKGKVKHRISAGPAKSFYINHPQHTQGTKAKLGFSVSYKSEILLGRKWNLLLGLDYFTQGLTFKGYYKAPTYTYLFDESYAYTHELRIQEVQLPIDVKIGFNYEREHFYTPYFIGGVAARYIFSSYSVISNDTTGITVYDGKDNIDFENQRLMKNLNAHYKVGLGLQYNIRSTGRAIFFEVTYRYGISRLHYDGNSSTNQLNIKDAHLVFLIGFRL